MLFTFTSLLLPDAFSHFLGNFEQLDRALGARAPQRAVPQQLEHAGPILGLTMLSNHSGQPSCVGLTGGGPRRAAGIASFVDLLPGRLSPLRRTRDWKMDSSARASRGAAWARR